MSNKSYPVSKNASNFHREQSDITEYTRFLMFSAAEIVPTKPVYISTGCDVR